jgi:hypothetical protein
MVELVKCLRESGVRSGTGQHGEDVSSAGDDVVGEATTESNKGMKQTKGGWKRGEASSSAAARSVVIVRGSRRSRPSQLIPGVRRTRKVRAGYGRLPASAETSEKQAANGPESAAVCPNNL